MVGCFAKSLAGHDKDEIYIVIKDDDEYVYLANGKQKLISCPKKKKKKHIQIIKKYSNECTNDEEIKRAIKLYQQDREVSECQKLM